MNSPLFAIVPLAGFVVWLGIVTYTVVMMTRLVKGVERIADSIERGRN